MKVVMLSHTKINKLHNGLIRRPNKSCPVISCSYSDNLQMQVKVRDKLSPFGNTCFHNHSFSLIIWFRDRGNSCNQTLATLFLNPHKASCGFSAHCTWSVLLRLHHQPRIGRHNRSDHQQGSVEMWWLCSPQTEHQPSGPHLWHGESSCCL